MFSAGVLCRFLLELVLVPWPFVLEGECQRAERPEAQPQAIQQAYSSILKQRPPRGVLSSSQSSANELRDVRTRPLLSESISAAFQLPAGSWAELQRSRQRPA